MKIIKSNKYKGLMIKNAINPELWKQKLQSIIAKVHQNINIYDAIKTEFPDLGEEQVEHIKDYVLGALYRDVSTAI